MKNLNTYHLKLTTLSPIHIGTGESYEPTNFVIDKNQLYEFDEVLFYKSLSDLDKKALSTKFDDWIQIIRFYKQHKDHAKKLAKFNCFVTSKVMHKYNTVVNKDGSQNKNQLEIHKTYKNPNNYRAIIPGSSLKGMFDTILRIYARPEVSSNVQRQKLVISDAILLDGGTEIGYCYRKHKNPSKQAKNPIPQIVEIIKPDSTFVLSIKSEYDFETIKSKMQEYFLLRDQERYEEIKQGFISRVGKFSGKPYMVYNPKDMKNSFGKEVATHTLYEKNDLPFGWIRVEKIEPDEFMHHQTIIEQLNKAYFEELQSRQKEILEAIEEAEAQERQKRLKQQKAKEEAQRKAQQEKEEREAMLASMTPLERKIEELKELNPNPNETIDVIIYKALKNGELDEFKYAALQLLKTEMQKLKRWVEKSKKPEKDKKYKRTQEVIQMLQEHQS